MPRKTWEDLSQSASAALGATSRDWSVGASDLIPDRGPLLWEDSFQTIHALPPEAFLIHFDKLADFSIDYRNSKITVTPRAGTSMSTIHHLLMDQVVPRILAHESDLVLHAAGVRLNDEAVLFVGPSGSGKSTLAASFDAAGHALLGDDAFVIAEVESRIEARTVYPSLRLNPDSIEEILSLSQSSPVADYTQKLNVFPHSGFAGALPVRALFLLDSAACSSTTVSAATDVDACVTLVEQSFALHPGDVRLAANRFNMAARVINHVATYRLGYPRDYKQLPAVREAVLATLH